VVGDFPQHEFTAERPEIGGKLNREINLQLNSQEEFQKKAKREGSFSAKFLQGKRS